MPDVFRDEGAELVEEAIKPDTFIEADIEGDIDGVKDSIYVVDMFFGTGIEPVGPPG